jgi:hypothetical protein
MTSVLDRIKKRRCYPVKEVEGAFVRSLTRGEANRVEALDGEEKTDFILGVALVDELGNPAFSQSPEETDSAFCQRIKEQTKDVDGATITAIIRAVGKVTQAAPLETTAKN